MIAAAVRCMTALCSLSLRIDEVRVHIAEGVGGRKDCVIEEYLIGNTAAAATEALRHEPARGRQHYVEQSAYAMVVCLHVAMFAPPLSRRRRGYDK